MIWPTFNEDNVWVGMGWKTTSGKKGNTTILGVEHQYISLAPPHWNALLCECTPEEREEREADLKERLHGI